MALDITLTAEHIAQLEAVIPFDPGFPTTMIVSSKHCADRVQFLIRFL